MFLQGLGGTLLPIPFLESLLPKNAWGQALSPNRYYIVLISDYDLGHQRNWLPSLQRPSNAYQIPGEHTIHYQNLSDYVSSPTSHLTKTFGSQKSIEDMDEDDEIDLDEILREMGYEDEYDYSDEDDISEDELQKILNDLEGESLDENFTVNPNSKGYKEGMKLVNDLRRGLFRKLDNDELDEFMGVLKMSFNLK